MAEKLEESQLVTHEELLVAQLNVYETKTRVGFKTFTAGGTKEIKDLKDECDALKKDSLIWKSESSLEILKRKVN